MGYFCKGVIKLLRDLKREIETYANRIEELRVSL